MKSFFVSILSACLLFACSDKGRGHEVPQSQVRVAVFSITHGGLVSMNVDGSDLKLIEKGDISAPCWSPDGQRIAYFSHIKEAPHLRIFTMNHEGTDRKPLLPEYAHRHYAPAWSPDGKRIAFMTQTGPNLTDREICVADADGNNLVQLTDDSELHHDGVVWTPDGKKLSFYAGVNFNFRLYLMNPDGSEKNRIGNFANASNITWSPDGQLFAFSQVEKDEIETHLFICNNFIGNNLGTEVRKLTDAQLRNLYPVWSPDGRYIAYSHYEKWGQDPMIRGDLVIFDVVKETHTTILQEALDKHVNARPSWIRNPHE